MSLTNPEKKYDWNFVTKFFFSIEMFNAHEYGKSLFGDVEIFMPRQLQLRENLTKEEGAIIMWPIK